MSTEVLILFAMVAAFLFAVWYRRNKKKQKSGSGKLYIRMISNKNGNKEWPQAFESVEQINSWWERREDLWEGVERIEVFEKPKAKALWS